MGGNPKSKIQNLRELRQIPTAGLRVYSVPFEPCILRRGRSSYAQIVLSEGHMNRSRDISAHLWPLEWLAPENSLLAVTYGFLKGA